jgi:hypothetical protein
MSKELKKIKPKTDRKEYIKNWKKEHPEKVKEYRKKYNEKKKLTYSDPLDERDF